MIATGFYKAPAGLHVPVRLYDIDPSTGAGTAPRATAAPSLIGLAWGPDNRLYGVSTQGAPPGYQSNALYRIDPATGATTLIGPTGLNGVFEGDLATDPQTGMIYGISGKQLFRFPNLTATTQNPAAQVVGQVNFPPGSGWEANGLAFDSSGKLYALIRSISVNSGPTYLVTLNPATAAVVGTVTLSQGTPSLGGLDFSVGGLDFVGGRLFYANGHEPSFQATPNNLYALYEINPSTGVATPRGLTNIVGGVASLVGCAPQMQGRTCTPPPPDLDAWYPLDGNGTDLVLGRNATAAGPFGYPPGKVAQAAVLYSTYMTVPDGPVLDQGRGDFSIDLWIVGMTAQSGIRAVIDKRTASGASVRGWSLFTYDGRPALQLADGGHSNYFDNRALSPGWHHVAVTVDRDNPQGIIFYIDGVPGVPANPTDRQGNLDNSGPTYFGRHSLNGTITGSLILDEIEFFDRVLGPTEVAAIFNAGEAGKCKAGF